MAEETKYTVADFAKQAKKMFGTTPEMVTVALRTAGKTTATIDEAKATVKEFLEKEVK